MTTKEEFYLDMLALKEKLEAKSTTWDKEDFHLAADDLICNLLIELGYGQGVKVFLDTPKWYA